MAVGLPLKTTYADGDVYSAGDINDTNGTINANASPYAAGKNKLINGDFFINQRNFSSQTTDGGYGFDRWRMYASSGGTYSAQTFTVGSAPVAGYEARNFARIVTTGQSGASVYTSFDQPIEDVRTFAGQTVTLSFWAKAASGSPKMSIELVQNVGSGGSGTAFVNGGTVTLTTSWVRYSKTIAIPSISGMTIGTGSHLSVAVWVSAGTTFAARTNSIGIQSNTFDMWGWQIEAGSTATPFQTATGTVQGELAACQRYYYRAVAGQVYGTLAQGVAIGTTQAHFFVPFPVTMRATPASTEYANLFISDVAVANFTFTSAAIVLNQSSSSFGYFTTSGSSGMTQFRPYILIGNNNAAGYVGFSAEL
jgi:hypothetical protein